MTNHIMLMDLEETIIRKVLHKQRYTTQQGSEA